MYNIPNLKVQILKLQPHILPYIYDYIYTGHTYAGDMSEIMHGITPW